MINLYTGIIEDRKDPEKMGRVRVRVVGVHSENRVQFATKDLPWSLVMNPINNASINGIGTTAMTGLVEGSTVIVTFLDEFMQQPLVLGSIASKHSKKPDTSKGFSDPNGVYPKDDMIGESDVNRLARGVPVDTILNKKIENQIKEVKTALSGVTWNEPISYAAEYPHNHVMQSEGGHVIELDDTEGNERVGINHRTGTYTEINAEGTQINHIVGDSFHIVENNGNLYVKGKCNITVGGDSNILCQSDANIEVANNLNLQAGGNANIGIKKDFNVVVDGNYNLKVAGGHNVQAGSYALTTSNYDISGSQVRIDGSRIMIGEGASTVSLGITTMKIDAPIFGNKPDVIVPALTVP